MISTQNQLPHKPSEPEMTLELEVELEPSPTAETPVDRRVRQRPARPQVTGIKGYIRHLTDSLVSLAGSGWQGWCILWLIICSALALLCWSLIFRTQYLEENVNLMANLSERRTVFSELLTEWSHDDLNQLRARVSNAESRVFPSYEVLAEWLSNLAVAADQLKLVLRYTMTPAESSKLEQVAEIPIEIYVSPKTANGRYTYLQMLEFAKRLIDDRWHIEIISALMQGQGDSANNLTAAIRIWVRDLQIAPTNTGMEADAELTQ